MEVLGKVLKYIDELPEGAPAGAKELLHLGAGTRWTKRFLDWRGVVN